MTSVRNCAAHSFEGPEIPIYSRIAILSSVPISSSRVGSSLLYIICQFQLLGIILATTIIDLRRDGFARAEVKHFFEQIPVFFDFEESPQMVKVLCGLLFIFGLYVILSIALLGYYFVKLRKKEMMHPLLIKTWTIALKLQDSIFFFGIYIISLKLMSSFIQDQVAENSVIERKDFVIPFSALVMAINFLYTLTIGILFSVKVKTKNSFSSKTKAIDSLDFAYKSLLPLSWVFQDYSEVYSSVLLIITLIYCLIRNVMFFQLLPFYKIRTLKYDTISHALLTSFAFAALLAKPISVARSYTEFHVIVLLWIVVGFPLTQFYLQVLNKLFLRILRNPEKVNSYQLLHYYAIYKHFSDAIPASRHERDFMKENYLHYSSMISTANVGSEEELDVYFLKMTLQLWEDHINKNHDLGLLKVMLAYYYSKKKGQYLLANHILEKNFKSGFFLQTSNSLVKLSIYDKLRQAHHQGEGEGGLKKTLDIQNLYRNLKNKVIKRLESEMKFWKVFQTISPDFITMLELANDVARIDRSIKRNANPNQNVYMEAGFTLPLLTYSLYFSFVKHDITNGQRFIRLYCNKISQQQNMIMLGGDSGLLDSNWRNFVFVISASYETIGKILDCSGHVNNLLCIEKERLVGKAFGSLMPHLYAQSFDNLMKTLYKESKSKFLDNKIMLPIQVDKGNDGSSVMFCWLYMTLIYLPEYGFCFHSLLMPTKSKERVAIVSANNGLILNFSKEFLEDMNIRNKEAAINIADFCPDFERFLSLSSATPVPLRERPSRRFQRSRTKTLGDPSASLISSWLHTEKISNPDGKTPDDPFWTTAKEGVKSTKLTFYPYSTTPGSERTPRSSAKIKDDPTMQVDYQVDIVEKTLQQTKVFELRMRRIKDEKDTSPKKSFRSWTKLFEKEAPLQLAHAQTLMTGVSTVSPLKAVLKNRYTFTNMKTIFSTEEIKFTTEIDHYQPGTATLSPEKNRQSASKKPSFKILQKELTFGTLMSPISENRKLIFPAMTNGDLEDVYQQTNMDEEELPPSSSKNDFDLGNKENEIVDAKMLEMNLIGRVLGEEESAENDDDDIGSVILFKKKIEAHRRLKKILQSQKYPRSALYYLLAFIFTQASLFVFLVWLNFNVSEISKNAEQLNEVITDFYFRSYHNELLNQDIMTLLALRSSADLSQYMGWGVDASTMDIYNLKNANSKLANSLTYLDEEIQQSFYEQNIGMYERNAYGELESIGKANLFQSVQKIIENGFANMARADFDVPGEFYINENMMFILDNSMNDLLIVGEEMVLRLERKLYDYFDTSRVKLRVSLSLILSVLTLFMFATVAMVIIIKKDTKEFMQKMFVLPHEVTGKIEKKLGLFKEALERDSFEGDLLLIYSLQYNGHHHSKGRKKRSHDTSTGNKRAVRSPTENVLKKFSRRNALLYFLLLLCLALTVGCVMIYYKQALRRVTVMNRQQNNLNYALNFINFLGQFMPAVEIAVLMNATTDFRNMPVLDGISSQLKRFKELDELQESLKDADGEYSETQKEILFGYDCNKVYTPLYSWPEELMLLECDFSSNGLGRISLNKVLTTLDIVLEQFLIQFEVVRYDMDATLQFYGEYVIQVISYLIDMGFLLMLRSFVSSRDDFSSLSKELERQRILLGWVAFLISLVLGALTWIFVVRKLLRREFERKKILALVPTKIIFGNFLLKNYVKRLACDPNDKLTNLGEII